MRQRILLAVLALSLILGLAAGTSALALWQGDGGATSAQEQQKPKKTPSKKKKVVKATVVEDEAPASEAASGTATTTAPAEPVPAESAGDQKQVEKERRQAEKEAEKEARRSAKAEQEAADRDARAAEKAQAQADREQREQQKAAEEAARREAKEGQKAEAQAQREAARAKEPEAPEAPAEPVAQPAAIPTPAAQKSARAASAPNTDVAPSRAAAPAAAAPAPAASTSAPVAVPADQPRASRPAPDVFSERLTVREVLLDVLVTDNKGDLVYGLGPDDFIVEEEEQPREVTSVAFYGGLPELRGTGEQGTRRTDRYFILLFHDQAQSLPALRGAQMDSGRWVKKWVEAKLEPNDQVAVLGYDVRLKVYEDFTRDRATLLQAIDNAVLGKREPDRWRQQEARTSTVESPSLLVNLPTGKTLSRQTRKLQQALELIGQAAEGIVGRKNLVLFSVGFGEVDEDFGLYTPDPRYYPDMMQALNTGNVAVYSVDMLGSVRGSPSLREINDSLSSISNDTGGHYYSSFTNVGTPLEQIAEDNLGYYLLSYKSGYEPGSSGYREVKVRTKNKSWNVRYRRGYRYGPTS